MTERKIFIWGMGLLGASLGFDLSQLGWKVAGTVRTRRSQETLQELGFENVFTFNEKKLWDHLCDSRGIVLGTPVEQIFTTLPELSQNGIPEDIWITDMASTKGELMEWVLAQDTPYLFVGSHPMAGSDLTGPQNARKALFSGATIYMTPADEMYDRHPEGEYQRVQNEIAGMWREVGANPHVLSHKVHDKWAAYLSHGLHLVSCMVAHLIKDIPGVYEVPGNPAGGSFRDITRVSGANPQLWNGIVSSNAEEVSAYMQSLEEMVHNWRKQMEAGTLPIERIFEEAGEIRRHIVKEKP